MMANKYYNLLGNILENGKRKIDRKAASVIC